MDREQILKAISRLSKSQGFYGRLLITLDSLKDNDLNRYEETMSELEAQNFKDELEMVLYFET